MFQPILYPEPAPTVMIGTASFWSNLVATGASIPATAYPAANRVLYVPIWVPKPITVLKVWVNVTSASGNVDLGLYSRQGSDPGRRLLSSGATLMTSAIQFISVTPTLVQPGTYFMAITVNNTSATIGASVGANAGVVAAQGVMSESTVSFGLPAQAAAAKTSDNYYPDIGLRMIA